MSDVLFKNSDVILLQKSRHFSDIFLFVEFLIKLQLSADDCKIKRYISQSAIMKEKTAGLKI